MQMTMEELEAKFSGIADQRIAEAAAKSEEEKKTVEAEEAKKANFRAAAYEVLKAADQKSEAHGSPVSDAWTLMGKYIMCGVKSANLSDNTRVASKEGALAAAKMIYPDDKALQALMQKDMETGIPSAGGYGIPQILSGETIPKLYETTILERTGATKVPMPNGNFRMTRMDTSASVGWVGELPSAANTQPVFGEINLKAKKLYAISLVSNSLLRYNAVDLSSWIMRDLQAKAVRKLDVTALYGTGAINIPLGLSNSGSGSKTPASSPGLLPAAQFTATAAFGLTTPLDMRAGLEQDNVPMLKPAFVFAPTVGGWIRGKAFSTGPFAWGMEMAARNTLNGDPFISSASSYYSSATTATGDLWLGDWSEFVWGVAYDISLEISREASFVYGGTTYSAFQRDETMVRLLAEHDFGVKHTQSFACRSVTQA